MGQPYNLTGLGNSENLLGLSQQVNILAGGYFGIMILISVFIILFISFKNFEGRKAFAASAFLTAIIAIFLRLLSLIPDIWMFGAFSIAALSFIYMVWGE